MGSHAFPVASFVCEQEKKERPRETVKHLHGDIKDLCASDSFEFFRESVFLGHFRPAKNRIFGANRLQ